MANLAELNQWEAGIYQLETTDPVEGGADGIDNLQAKQLANRTKYLKSLVDGLTTGKQPLDATLTAIAAIVTAADKLIYATGADTFATTTLTAFARTLLDDIDAAAMRTTLGLGSAATVTADTDGTLAANSDSRVATQKAIKTYVDGLIAANDAMVFKGVIDCSANPNYPAADRGHTYRVSVAGKIGGAAGVNVEVGDIVLCSADGTAAGTHAAVGANWGVIQANLDGALLTSAIGNTVQGYDATLAAIAALALAADKLIYATGANTVATTTLTAFARTLLDDASAAAMRATLGLGSAATVTADTDGTLAANSDSSVATQKAIKTYVDGIIAANDAMVFKGVINCSANPNYPAADAGHTYRVSVSGKIGGAAGVNVEVGDLIICQTDGTLSGNQATVGSNWGVIQTNLDGSVISTDIQAQTYTAFTTAGTGAAFTLTPSPAIAAYAANQRFRVKFHAAGSGTINVSGKGAKNLRRYDDTGAKVAVSVTAGQLADIEYDGTDFVILNPLPLPIPQVVILTTASALSASNVQTIAHGLGAVPKIMYQQLLVMTAVAGWSVGDVIGRWMDGVSGVADSVIGVGADGTNVIVSCGSSANVAIPNKTTGVPTATAVTNFKIQVGVAL